jgi:hypothetical protein
MTPGDADDDALQSLCERGQRLLMETRYLESEAALAEAERLAWAAQDWDTVARLYMPLQEARRQRRQRCGEGLVVLDLVAEGPDDRMEGRHVVEHYPHGQLLVAGWGTVEPAAQVRRLAATHGLYVETFLAAAYPLAEGGRAVVVVPLEEMQAHLPGPTPPTTRDALAKAVPPQCLVLHENELPRGSRRGDTKTYAEVMALWERLHAPFLAAADNEPDLVRRMEGYRTAARVDYASELAHQKLSDIAHRLARERRNATAVPA